VTHDDDILAAEYALGLLSADEATATEARLRADAALSLRVAWWRDQLSPLADAAGVEPPPAVWRAITARLGANDNPPVADPARRWKWATAGMGAIAASLLVALLTLPGPPPPAAPQPVRPTLLVAGIAGERGAAVAIAFDAGNRRMLVTPVALDAGKGDAELWIIPAGGTVPVSLGVIDVNAARQHSLDPRHGALLVPGATFAISQEAKGGSSTGAPQGPVVASGKISRV